MEPVTGTTIVLGVKAAVNAMKASDSKLSHTLFGPVLAEFGDWMAAAVKRRRENAEQIVTKAAEIADAQSPRVGEEHYANPRLLKGLIDDGSWADAPMCHSYLAGLLAGGRSENGQDDHNLTWLSIANALGSAEILVHYTAYRLLVGDEKIQDARSGRSRI